MHTRFALASAILLCGCTAAPVPDAEQNTTLDSQETGEAGTFAMENNVQLPSNWPEDVPLYPDMTIAYVWEMGEDKNGNFQGTSIFETTADVMQVQSFYQAFLYSNGWIVETGVEPGDIQVLFGTKGGRTVKVSIEGGPLTTISISLTEQ